MKLVSINRASEILGVSQKTIRLWEKEGKINAYYTPNGHRRYDQDYLLNYFSNIKK